MITPTHCVNATCILKIINKWSEDWETFWRWILTMCIAIANQYRKFWDVRDGIAWTRLLLIIDSCSNVSVTCEKIGTESLEKCIVGLLGCEDRHGWLLIDFCLTVIANVI